MGTPAGGLTAREAVLVSVAAGQGVEVAVRVAALHELFGDAVRRYVAQRFGGADVEALAQEVWVRAMQAIGRYVDDEGEAVERRHARLRAWAYGTAHNLAVDDARKRWLRRGWQVAPDESDAVVAHVAGADEVLAEREGERRVRVAIRRVRRESPIAAEVLAMLAGGYSIGRIRARLAVGRPRATHLVADARARLRRALQAVDDGAGGSP